MTLDDCLADPKLAAEFANVSLPDDSSLLMLLFGIDEFEALVTYPTPVQQEQIACATTLLNNLLELRHQIDSADGAFPNSSVDAVGPRTASALSKLSASALTDIMTAIHQSQGAQLSSLPRGLFGAVYGSVYDELEAAFELHFKWTQEYADMVNNWRQQRQNSQLGNREGDVSVLTLDEILANQWTCTVLWAYLYRTSHHHRLSFLMEMQFNLEPVVAQFDASADEDGQSSSLQRVIDCIKALHLKFLRPSAVVVLPVASPAVAQLKDDMCGQVARLDDATTIGDVSDHLVDSVLESVRLLADAVYDEFKTFSFERYSSFIASSLYRDFIATRAAHGDLLRLLRSNDISFHQPPNAVPVVHDLCAMAMAQRAVVQGERTNADPAILRMFAFIKRDTISADGRVHPFEYIKLLPGDASDNTPEEDDADITFLRTIESFLIPEAAPQTLHITEREARRHVAFNFVAGAGDDVLYGAVLRTPLLQLDGDARASTTAQGVCVISRAPLVDSLRRFLSTFWQTQSDPDLVEASSVLHSSRSIVDCEGDSLHHALVSAHNELDAYLLDRHDSPSGAADEVSTSSELLNVDFQLVDLFECLSISHVLKLLACVLTEKKIVLVSSSFSVLLAVGEAVRALLLPLTWHHVYVPVLPLALKAYLHCPSPFIFGLHTSYVRECELPRPSDDLVIVNLDRDSITGGGDAALPPARYSALRDKLFQLCHPRIARRDAISYDGEQSASPERFPERPVRLAFLDELRAMLASLDMLAFRFEFGSAKAAVVDVRDRAPRPWPADAARFMTALLQTQAFSAYVGSGHCHHQHSRSWCEAR